MAPNPAFPLLLLCDTPIQFAELANTFLLENLARKRPGFTLGRLRFLQFADALLRTWAVVEGRAAPVRFFLVDAKVDAKHEKARRFYLKFGMKPPGDDSRHLYLS